MSNPNLFHAFHPVSAKAWKQKIQFDLNGADYNETLVWKTAENINVKPFYNKEDLPNDITPPKTPATTWTINEQIEVDDDVIANKKALKALKQGSESITFIITTDLCQVNVLLDAINLNHVAIYFKLNVLSVEFVRQLNHIAATQKTSFYVFTDIIGHLAKTGNWYSTLKNDHDTLEQILRNSTNLKSSLSIHLDLYQNAGATMLQQLAYALAHANEYLNSFEALIKTKVTFFTAMGSNYFFEIAKLRALRLLWASLASEYNVNTNCHIVAQPSKRNKTIYDYNTNMLRTTTECMSAILGGANSITNLTYDHLFHNQNDFSNRIARNQLLILKHESYFDKVNNPVDGTYYIESLTKQMAEKALTIFKDIEANGGFLKQLKAGIIQKKIKESASKEQNDFNSGNIVLLGTNKHPNAKDVMKDKLERHPFLKTKSRKTLIEPIIQRRLAEQIEQERLKKE